MEEVWWAMKNKRNAEGCVIVIKVSLSARAVVLCGANTAKNLGAKKNTECLVSTQTNLIRISRSEA